MIRLLSIVFLLSFCNTIYAQDNNYEMDVNQLFEFKIDSIEKRLSINNWGIDTSHYLHYTVTNISKYNLTYTTNSCFYYNHYSLKVGPQEFDINPMGGCPFNGRDIHEMAPGEKFKEIESISAFNIDQLELGTWNMKIQVPLVNNSIGFRVDGRHFVENQQFLIYEGKSKIIETSVDNRKHKKKKKKNLTKPSLNSRTKTIENQNLTEKNACGIESVTLKTERVEKKTYLAILEFKTEKSHCY